MNFQFNNSFFYKALFLIDKEYLKLFTAGFLIVISSCAELISLGLIGPYVAIIINPDSSLLLKTNQILFSYGYQLDYRELVILLSSLLIFIFLLKTLITIIITIYIKYLCNQKVFELRHKIFKSYQGMPYIRFLEKTHSEFIYSIYNLTEIYVNKVFFQFLIISSEMFIGISIILFLAWQDFSILISLLIVLSLFSFLYDFFVRRRSTILGKKAIHHGRNLVQSIKDSMEAFKEIRVFSKENYFLHKSDFHTKGYNINSFYSFIIGLLPRYLLEFTIVTFMLTTILVHIYMGTEIYSLISKLAIFGLAAIRLVPIISKLTQGLNDLRFGKEATIKLYDEFQLFENKRSISEEVYRDKISFKSLKLKNISFHYQDINLKQINNISLDILKGDRVGLVGNSGSGKTTFINVIMSLLSPQDGELILNDKKIENSLDEKRLQSIIAYLPQETFIMHGTILDNVAFGVNADEVDLNKVNESLKKSKLSEFILNLKDGIYTEVGDKGLKVSGGQRQRIALARAFYFDRQILILDESTNSLDSNTESEILDEIHSSSLESITFIIITHKKQTLKGCNKIYELKNGYLSKISADTSKL